MAQEKDIVLIYLEDAPIFFARIEDISPDHKKDWYHVKLLVLQVPVSTITWILRDIYIEGGEFTMNGKRMRLELVVCPDEPIESINEEKEEEEKTSPKSPQDAKVISLSDRKPK